jgi:alkaline phosphatase D
MQNIKQFPAFLPLFIFFLFINCQGNGVENTSKPIATKGPYFGNGFHNGWVDQHSAVIWTRLTQSPEGNPANNQFIDISRKRAAQLNQLANPDSIHLAQIPKGLTLEDMVGACPGAKGQVRLQYFPENGTNKLGLPWQEVDPFKNFTIQWTLKDLTPDTKYQVLLQARANASAPISHEFKGSFITAPTKETPKDINFCVVSCHDYLRKDLPDGHKIYPAMTSLQPDFYVHTGDIEYYDKPSPWAMTEALMRYKWDRLFALPIQRKFWSQTTTYFMKDDHDALSNDAYPGKKYGTVNFERGLDIFDKEQFPTNPQPYKTIAWGKNLQIWIVEGRNFRSKNTEEDGPHKTIWGKEQKEWFFQSVQQSDATFKILISPTPLLGPDRGKGKNDNHSNLVFKHEGDELRNFINQQKNFFICNGDRHWQYVTHLQNTNLWEFSCGAGADGHAGGWPPNDKREEHRFLRVKGGFLNVKVSEENGKNLIFFRHYDVEGNMVNEERFEAS